MSKLRSYKKILLEPAKHRIFLTIIFFIAAFLIFLLSGHSWERGSITDIMMRLASLTLIMVGTFGRIWCSLYLSGKKNKELVVVGPYSLTRNPLYLFNLIGALGLGLGSQNLLVLALIAIAFGLFYPSVIRAEERQLEEKYGEAYRQYKESVPGFFPRTLALQEPEKLEVYPRKIRNVIMESTWFVWIFIIMAVIETLRKSGILPVLWRIP
jgi:protein-S-isoprenylcysteine O-methyltransferase Ste14